MNAKRRTAGAAMTDEQRFLAEYDASRFPHPSVAVDVALVTVRDGQLQALLVRRVEHPHLGRWSLPGGFVGMDESLDDAARRILQTKAGPSDAFLEQLFTFGEPDRDPRTRVISVAYYGLVEPAPLEAALNGSGARLMEIRVAWKGERGGPATAHGPDGKRLKLAFDHADMLGLVVQRLRGKLDYAPIGFELLPRQFTLRQLQQIHESILGRGLNKDSFRRRMLATGLLAATGRHEAQVGHRPAELYRFRKRAART